MEKILTEKEVSELMLILDVIEVALKKENLWAEKRSEDLDWWLPLHEWIRFIMLPRDKGILATSRLPASSRIGMMARSEQQGGVLPEYSEELIKLFETYDQKLEG